MLSASALGVSAVLIGLVIARIVGIVPGGTIVLVAGAEFAVTTALASRHRTPQPVAH